MKRLRISRIVRLIGLLTGTFAFAIVGARGATQPGIAGSGCLILQDGSNTTYLLDTTNGQSVEVPPVDPKALGQGIDSIVFEFKNDISSVYSAHRADKEVMLISIDARTGRRFTVPVQSLDDIYLRPSADGNYVAAFSYTDSQVGLNIYALPDWQLMVSRPWHSDQIFQDIAWSPSGHQLAYLEHSADNHGLLMQFDPDTQQFASAIIIPDITKYASSGYSRITWSHDGQALAIHNDTRLDLYMIKSHAIQNVTDGADFHYEPGVGSPYVAWVGNTHRISYPPHDAQNGVMLWVYNLDNGERTLLVRQANDGILYSTDAAYVLFDSSDAGGLPSTVMLNLLTQQRIVVQENAGVMTANFWQLQDATKPIVLGYGDELLRIDLDGSNKRVIKMVSGYYTSLPYSENRLAYSSPSQGPAEVGLINLDTGERRRLGDVPNGFGNLFRSPDGRVIAFMTEGNVIMLSLFASDGSWSHTFHTDSGKYSRLVWSPDSTQIALMTYDWGQKNKVHILTAKGEQLRQFELPPKDLLFNTWNNCEIP